MKHKWLTALGVMTIMMSGLATADGDPLAGQEKAYTCMGCHGAPGMRNAYPAYRVPKLGGQHAGYIVTALKAYRNKSRSHPSAATVRVLLNGSLGSGVRACSAIERIRVTQVWVVNQAATYSR